MLLANIDDAGMILPRFRISPELRLEVFDIHGHDDVPVLNRIIEQALIVVVNVTRNVDVNIPDNRDAKGARQLNGGAIDILIGKKDILTRGLVGYEGAFDSRIMS